ncbi:P-loop ATPase, Sll1717 family [Clostridium botulinum]|nr:hypothetical protein [Clostridium botulinum]KOC31827.1 hypothetical protein ADU83_11900 [Clostridium botulinum]
MSQIHKPKIFGHKKKSKSSSNKRKEFYKVLDEIEELILLCLKYKSIILIIDDLDELNINIEADNKSLIAIAKLIDAFKDVNTLLLKKGLTSSRCIMLLRRDILNKLNKRSSNLNKILSDNIIDLYWITKKENSPEKHMLMEMILNKIRYSCQEYKNLDNKALYYKLFPRNINGDTTLKFLIDNSFGRPRDIICYLDVIAKANPNEVTFEEKMFRSCKQAYSQRFLQELYNEMSLHFELEIVENYLLLIRKFGRNSFYYNGIKRFYRKHKKTFNYISSLDDALEDLYKFGVIGNCWQVHHGRPDESYQYSWGYRRDGNPKIDMDRKFTVHYGLRKALNTN